MFLKSLLLVGTALGLSVVCSAQPNTNIRLINPPGLSKSTGYSHIGEVKGGKMYFISGQVSSDSLGNVIGKGDIKTQTEHVYCNLEKALQAIGATYQDVVKFKDMSKINEFREVRNRLFNEKYYKNQANRPVSTAIGVTELFNPDWLLEIEATVVLPNQSMMTAEQVVQGNLNAYNARDIERFMAYFSPNIEMYNFADNKLTAKGLADVRKIYAELFDLSPKLHSQIVNRIVFDNKVIDHEYITGRRGSDTPVELVLIYEVKDGKIVRITAIRR